MKGKLGGAAQLYKMSREEREDARLRHRSEWFAKQKRLKRAQEADESALIRKATSNAPVLLTKGVSPETPVPSGEGALPSQREGRGGGGTDEQV